MNSRILLFLLVTGVIVWLISLKVNRIVPESFPQTNNHPFSSPNVPSAANKPTAGVETKSKIVNEAKTEGKKQTSSQEENDPPTPLPNPLRKKPRSNRTITKKRLESLSSSEDIARFLDDLRFDSLEYFFRDGMLIDRQSPDPNLFGLKGTFVGPVESTENGQKIWDMRMDFDKFGEGVAQIVIEVADDGQNYRTLGGPGGTNSSGYRYIDNLGLAIVSTENDRFEMFYLPQKDSFIGNYYRGGLHSMKPNGTLILQRAQ